MSAPVGGVWAMKSGDFQPTNFANSDSGVVAALSYASTNGVVQVSPQSSLTVSSIWTVPQGCELRLGSGTYTFEGASGISLGNFATLRGSGYGATSLKVGTTFSSASLVYNTTTDGTQQACFVYNIEVNGNKAAGAAVTQAIYLKGVGQPSVIRDTVVYACSGIGILIEGVSSNAASLPFVDNCWVNTSNDYGLKVTGPMGAVTIWRSSFENIPTGKAGIYIDGTASSTLQASVWIQDTHIEGLASGAIGILLEDSRDVSVDKVVYFGSGGNGDLVKITGLAADSYNITLKDLYVKYNATATTVNDTTNSVSLTNEVPYYSTAAHRMGSLTVTGTGDVSGNTTVGGTLGVTGATTLTGALSANAATNSFGTAGIAQTTTVGKGGTGTDTSVVIVDSGSGAGAQARYTLRRNSSTDMSILITGSLEQIQFRNALQFANILGTAAAYMTTGGKLRLGDGSTPTQQLEVVGSPLFSALTSGKYPKISTGGLIIDGPTPLAGTKIYYVADSSGGAVTRKLTFTDGILTAET